VVPEALVLGSDERQPQVLGHLVVRDDDPFLHRELGDDRPVVGEDLGDDARLVALELLDERQIALIGENEPGKGAAHRREGKERGYDEDLEELSPPVRGAPGRDGVGRGRSGSIHESSIILTVFAPARLEERRSARESGSGSRSKGASSA
jgi:hypothetical protein